jgi:surface protein
MGSMFSDATAFNSIISQWDVSSVTDMSAMFANSIFNGDIALWDVSSVTNMTIMFDGVTLNTNVYSGILQGWSSQSLKSNVTFSAGSSKYSPLAQAARDALVNNYNWTITDWGVESL